MTDYIQKIPVKFTAKERDLLLNYIYLDPNLKLVIFKSKEDVIYYSLNELGKLIGYIAAESNHVNDKKMEKALDHLYDRLSELLDSYIYYEDI